MQRNFDIKENVTINATIIGAAFMFERIKFTESLKLYLSFNVLFLNDNLTCCACKLCTINLPGDLDWA